MHEKDNMLRSMTGFGRCVIEDEDGTQIWEIRSLNGRHLDIKWRLPSHVRYLESRLERVVKRMAGRGRIDITLTLQASEKTQSTIRFDALQAAGIMTVLKDFATQQDMVFTPDIMALTHMDRLWSTPLQEEQTDELVLRLEEGLNMALDDWNESREIEASVLGRDMIERCMRLEEWVQRIEERAPDIKEDRFSVLRERLHLALAEKNAELDDARFLQEMVILADKLDISEELTRLSAHFERFRELLAQGSDVGRRLDFTLQECFREIATCGNKIQDAQLSRVIVDCKNELEKCREQVQNLE